MSFVDWLHQPEHTGENRCTPCTVVNITIATGASVLAALSSTVLGAGVFVFSLATIYFRGYLVPGTPTLTKQYLPNRVLKWFDKDTTASVTDETVEIDPERILLDADAVEPCQEGTDLCLTPTFREAWQERICSVRAHDPSGDHLTSVLGIPSENNRVTFDQYGDAFVASTDDAVIGQWSSQAAVIADAGAATELSERSPVWADLTPAEIARTLMSLRIFLETCPACDGSVHVEQEVVESCCRSYDVVASVCQDCDARLFEMEWNDAVTTDTETEAQPTQSAQAGA